MSPLKKAFNASSARSFSHHLYAARVAQVQRNMFPVGKDQGRALDAVVGIKDVIVAVVPNVQADMPNLDGSRKIQLDPFADARPRNPFHPGGFEQAVNGRPGVVGAPTI